MRNAFSWPGLACLAAVAATTLVPDSAAVAGASGFNVVAVIPLPGVTGRMDHLAYDPATRTVFIAALGNDTVEAVDVSARRVERSLPGFNEPQGVAYSPALRRLYVASADGQVKSFKREDLSLDQSVDVGMDADNVRIDEQAQRLYVGHGDGAIAVLDARTLARIADIPLRAHPESFQLVPGDARLVVNVPDSNEIAVLDLARATQSGRWSNGSGRSANYPLAIDAQNGRAIAVFRKPARIVAYDLARGAVIATLPILFLADDVFIDERRHQVYVVCGEGVVDVLMNPALRRIARLPTMAGARTGLFSADADRLFVAARANGHVPAALWVLAPTP